ncbi:MAG TPA: SPOR domain-containing protein [Thermotogota bacterium]|nr:SPOR domain-containing protein [Thermotogota bacterium]HPB87310.1 SPOR domain-containing protein [Thermotogota bacterium]
MENLQPIHRKPGGRSVNQRAEYGKGYMGPAIPIEPQPKKPKASNRLGLSPVQGQLLAIIVISLALAVVLLGFWINRLLTERQNKDFIIQNLSSRVQNLENVAQEYETTLAGTPADTYRPLPTDISATVAPGIENPDMAKKESFEFERFFKNAEITIYEGKPLTFYICNDQAALRLIRDSQLPYLLSAYSDNEYSLVLIGRYEPAWVVQLDNLQKIRREFMNHLITLSASPTQTGTSTALPSIPEIPEDLQGLELRRLYTLYNIQISADSSLEKLKTQTGILRNEGIPAFIYGYSSSGTSLLYSLRVGIFPTDQDAKKYSEQMDRVLYRELIHKEITDRFIRQLAIPQ